MSFWTAASADAAILSLFFFFHVPLRRFLASHNWAADMLKKKEKRKRKIRLDSKRVHSEDVLVTGENVVPGQKIIKTLWKAKHYYLIMFKIKYFVLGQKMATISVKIEQLEPFFFQIFLPYVSSIITPTHTVHHYYYDYTVLLFIGSIYDWFYLLLLLLLLLFLMAVNQRGKLLSLPIQLVPYIEQ